eukprot:scaffold5668_cov87-Skeletonema_marinoi.AAC.10
MALSYIELDTRELAHGENLPVGMAEAGRCIGRDVRAALDLLLDEEGGEPRVEIIPRVRYMEEGMYAQQRIKDMLQERKERLKISIRYAVSRSTTFHPKQALQLLFFQDRSTKRRRIDIHIFFIFIIVHALVTAMDYFFTHSKVPRKITTAAILSITPFASSVTCSPGVLAAAPRTFLTGSSGNTHAAEAITITVACGTSPVVGNHTYWSCCICIGCVCFGCILRTQIGQSPKMWLTTTIDRIRSDGGRDVREATIVIVSCDESDE